MSLQTRLEALAAAVGADVKALQAGGSSSSASGLPSWAGTRTKSFDAKLGAYNFRQNNTRRIMNALHKAQFGTGAAHIVNISDSSSSGFIGGGSPAGYDLLGAWPMAMRDILKRELGVPSGGTGIVPAAQWPLSDTDKMTPLGPRWVPNAAGSWINSGGYSYSNGANTYVTFYSDQPGTQVDLYYFGNNGQFGVQIDGGTIVNPPRSGILEVQKYTVSNLPNKLHTIGIVDNLADGAAAAIVGINVSTPGQGLHMHNLGIYGEKAYVWDQATDPTLAAMNRQLQVDLLGNNMVDLLILKIGANDVTAGQTPAQIKTSLTNIRNKSRYAQADVMIIAQALDPGTPGGLGYLQAMYDLADQFDCPLVDTAFLHGTAAQGLANGIITPIDNTHYNARGQKQTGLEVAAVFDDMLGTKPPNPVTEPLDLISRARAPYYVSHRGGSNRFPEESNIGLAQSLTDGFWLEVDVQPNADGELVTMHDDTVDRTTTGTGTVLSKNTETFKALGLDPSIPGAVKAPTMLWDEVMTQYGGRQVIMPEMKGTNWTYGQRQAFFDGIIAQGLQKSVIIQSFTYSYVLEAIARGLKGFALGTSQTATQMAADGVWGVGIPTSATTTYINQCKAAGLKVIAYTINTKALRDTWITTNGCDGIFTDDAWWVSKRWPLPALNARESIGDDWGMKIPWPGMQGNPKLADLASGVTTRSPRGEFVGGKGWTPFPYNGEAAADGFTYGAPMSFVPPRGPNVVIRTRVFMGSKANSQTRWASIYWGALNPEVGFNDSLTEANGGYHFLYRRNGTLELYNCPANGSAVSLGTTTTGPVLAAGNEGDLIMELEINATNVICRTIAGGTTTTFSIANTLYRPTNGLAQLSCNSQYVEFSDFSVRGI